MSNPSVQCSNCVFVTYGAECPECGEISTPSLTLGYQSTLESLYGSEASPVYDEGMDIMLRGKQHREAEMAKRGLRPKEKGERRRMSKKEYLRKNRRKFWDSLPKRDSITLST